MWIVGTSTHFSLAPRFTTYIIPTDHLFDSYIVVVIETHEYAALRFDENTSWTVYVKINFTLWTVHCQTCQ